MKNIGERLEQARVARNISLKEVAARLKIREEYLFSMEKNDFSYNMPDVYRRGFLRLYAEFLKLNPDEIMQEYKAMSMVQDAHSKHLGAQILGRITASELSQDDTPATDGDNLDVSGRFESGKDYFGTSPNPLDSDGDGKKYLKIAAVFVATIAVCALLFWGLSALLSKSLKSNTENSETTPQETIVSQTAALNDYTLGILCTGDSDTYINLHYPDTANSPIYAGAIKSGEKKEFKVSGKVVMRVTDIEKIKIEKNGEVLDFQKKKPMRGIKTLSINPPAK
ncbi:MAG: helix-turn-helix domain-containing protein [Opitutales bacterium]|nr:helix-turn-helix domain-containing protein [Opitutales bacterium]